jgi:hypothetical protein
MALGRKKVPHPCSNASNVLKYKMDETVILPVVLHEHVICSLTQREKYTIRLAEKRVLRGIFGPKKTKY